MFMSRAYLVLKEENAALRAECEGLHRELAGVRRQATEREVGERLLAAQYENLFAYDGTPQPERAQTEGV